jgi:hypothetical protein
MAGNEDTSCEQLVQRFEVAFGAMWWRARQTLGDVTLIAIADRVLYSATEQYPMLSALTADADGLHCQALKERAAELPRDQLADGICLLLTEFLSVLGNLTAEILTPGLHSELAKVEHADDDGGKETDS